jgi:hypothetical protein
MTDKKKKTGKVLPFPSRPRKVVRAAKVDYHFATCPECGNKIKLEPGPLLQSSKGIHFPVLVGAICRKCNSEVRNNPAAWVRLENPQRPLFHLLGLRRQTPETKP